MINFSSDFCFQISYTLKPFAFSEEQKYSANSESTTTVNPKCIPDPLGRLGRLSGDVFAGYPLSGDQSTASNGNVTFKSDKSLLKIMFSLDYLKEKTVKIYIFGGRT